MTNELFAIASEEYNRGNYRKALKLFLESANSGDADSMLMLGVMYGSGKGVEINFKRSIEWDKKGCCSWEYFCYFKSWDHLSHYR